MKQTIFNPELKETISFIKTSAETNGLYSELEILLERGGGNLMHYHISYTELFTAVKGNLRLELKKGKKVILKPDEWYLVKKNEIHLFFNTGDEQIVFLNKGELAVISWKPIIVY